MDGVHMVRWLARVHQGIHSSQTGSPAARHTPEGIGHAGEGGQIGDKADIETAGTSHGGSLRKIEES